MDTKNIWPDIVTSDLHAVQQWISSSHPGFIDQQNNSFHNWFKTGFEKAMALACKTETREDALALLRYYITGFEDNHLSVRDPSLDISSVEWAGWSVRPEAGKFRVFKVDKSRDDMPPVGAELLDCDGLTPKEFIFQNVAPYFDRRLTLESVQSRNASLLSIRAGSFPTFNNVHPAHCRFLIEQHKTVNISVQWREFHVPKMARQEKFSVEDYLTEGVWVRIPSFQMTPSEHSENLGLLRMHRRPIGAGPLVFDLRGNSGGNSEIGNEILRSLVGDRPQRLAAKSFSEWRVSRLSVDTLKNHVDQLTKMFGGSHPSTIAITELYRRAQEALLLSRDWVRQPDDPQLSDEGEHEGGFFGKIVAIVDGNCASACLDFVDSIRLFTDVVILGRQTGADTVYLDSTQVALPSGNFLDIPLKVWRGRARQSNEPITPDIPFPSEFDDVHQLKRWVTEMLERR